MKATFIFITERRSARENWIVSINAATRIHDLSYSTFIQGLVKEDIAINRYLIDFDEKNFMDCRKMLTTLAQTEPLSFRALVERIKQNIPQRPPPPEILP